MATAVGGDGVTPLPVPGPRSHLSMVTLTETTLLLYGGALCIPGCTCWGDSWLYDTNNKKWTVLNTTDAPIHRYRQNLVVHGQEGAAYLFGGESYQPYMYHNAVNRLVLPQPLAQQMIDYAGGPVEAKGGGGRGGKGKGHGMFGRTARLAEVDGPSFIQTASSYTSSASQGAFKALGSPSSSEHTPPGMALALPVIALLGGLAVWGVRSRQKRHSGKYDSIGAE